MKIKFIISECLGDEVVFTATVHSIKKQHPDWQLAVQAAKPDVWVNNPDIVQATDQFLSFPAKYHAINESNQRSITYLQAPLEWVNKELNLNLTMQTNRGHIYLSDEEKLKYSDWEPYWLVIPSGKQDYTAKLWAPSYWQEVVNHFIGRVSFVQSLEKSGYGCGKLKNIAHYAVDLNIRDLFSLVYNSSGVISHVTSFQHIAAAFQRPFLCIAGGREGATWIQSYPFQHTLHSNGTLDCNLHGGCWKARTVPVGDNDEKDANLCLHPIFYEQTWTPKCLINIRPRHVIGTLERLL